MKKYLLPFLACLALALTARAELYLYTDLGTLSSYTILQPTGINNSGIIVGTAYENTGGGRPMAFKYTSGTINLFASPGPAHSAWGNAVNAGGTLAGFCDRTGSILHGFYVAPGALYGADFDSDFTRNSQAVSINDYNYVVGTASSQPFIGHTGGWMALLGSTVGNSFSPRGINNNFEIVGNGVFGGMVYNAWTGAITFLGTALGDYSNQAGAINQSGTVAGKVGTTGYLYAGGDVSYFGYGISEVKSINAAADVVGVTTGGHGFVYIRSTGHFLDLNSVLPASVAATWTIVSATGINDGGVICGQSRRLSTAADVPYPGMYVYSAYKLSPFVLHVPIGFAPTP